MTKSGKPSPVADVRYFAGDGYAYVEGCHEATAFGRRVVLILRSLGYSFGAWTHLYIRAVERDCDADDASGLPSDGAEWWHRFFDISVPLGFCSMEERERDRILIDKTQAVLKSIFQDKAVDVDEACSAALRERDALRFLIKRKRLRGRDLEMSFNVATWPSPSNLQVVIRDQATCSDLAAPPIELQFYTDAFSLAGDLRMDGATIRVLPKTSFTAQLTAERYKNALAIPLSDFQTLDRAARTSNLVADPL